MVIQQDPSNCAKECQLHWAEPREVKDNFYKLSKTNGKSAKHSYLREKNLNPALLAVETFHENLDMNWLSKKNI